MVSIIRLLSLGKITKNVPHSVRVFNTQCSKKRLVEILTELIIHLGVFAFSGIQILPWRHNCHIDMHDNNMRIDTAKRKACMQCIQNAITQYCMV